MGKKFIEGLFWGSGFSLSVAIVLSIFIAVSSAIESYLVEKNSVAPTPAEISNFSVLNVSHRLVESSDEYDGGLIISGELQWNEQNDFGSLKITTHVTNQEGVYADSCYGYARQTVKDKTIYRFRVMCKDFNSESQIGDYEIELYGIPKEQS